MSVCVENDFHDIFVYGNQNDYWNRQSPYKEDTRLEKRQLEYNKAES